MDYFFEKPKRYIIKFICKLKEMFILDLYTEKGTLWAAEVFNFEL